MKKILIMLVLSFFGLNIFSQSKIKILENKVNFQRPSDIVLRSEIPEFSNAEEARKYLTGKFILTINIENEEIFRATDDFWLPEKIRFLLKKRNITHSDYLVLLDQSVII